MKQLLFLLLFPCLALAQYQGNAGQKITLGEQTSADGLVWRGITSDTSNLMTNKLDTSAYLVLDTITEAIWLYRASTTPKWNRVVDSLNNLQGQLSLTTKVTGVLPVANGGTNTGTAFTAGSVVFAGASGTYTQDNSGIYYNSTNKSLSIGKKNDDNNFVLDLENSTATNAILRIRSLNPTASTRLRVQNDSTQFVDFILYGKNTTTTYAGYNLKDVAMFNAGNADVLIGANSSRDLVFITNQSNRALVKGDGEFLIGYTKAEDVGSYRLQVKDSLYVGGRVSAAGYTTRSDYNLKDEIQTLNYGLNEVIQMQPVKYTYKSNGEQQLGFIAQDIGTLIPESVHFDEFMGVDYQSIIPILTKAIQEQQALIKALEQRILILENK